LIAIFSGEKHGDGGAVTVELLVKADTFAETTTNISLLQARIQIILTNETIACGLARRTLNYERMIS
jgi:hypothetical protein